MPSKKPCIMIRTDKDLIDRFAKLCESEKRSMSNMGEILITRAVEEYEQQQDRSEHKKQLEKSSISRTG